MGTNPKSCFLSGMGGRSLVLFQGKKVWNYFFGGVGWGGWIRKGVGIYIFLIFCNMVI
jgi:hypothetical protein